METAGAVEAGTSWLAELHDHHVAATSIPEPGDTEASQFDAAPGPFTARIAGDRPHSGISGFGYSVRLWAGSSQGIPFPDIKHVADVIRRNASFQEGITEIDPDELAPHLVQELDYSVAEVVVPYQSEIDGNNTYENTAITKSFDAAIQIVQRFQAALYAIRRYPYREATKELCPPVIRYLTGYTDAVNVVDGYPVREWISNGLVLRVDPGEFGRAPMLSDEEYVDLDNVMWSQIQGRPFGSYMELRREATVSLERIGDYRGSVIWSATAAESVFDELLRHLMWEQNQQPEKCLSEFEIQSVAQRVRLYFQPKLGGTWDLVTPGPITNWKTKVADIRNRVVHNYYRPTYAEAHEAIMVVDDLIHHIVDLLVSRLNLYFRTAMQLAGGEGLQRRGVYENFQQYMEASHQLNWHATYSRWRRSHELLLGTLRVPSLERAKLYFVYGRRNRGYWLVVDPQTELAARVLVDESSIDPALLTNIVRRLDGPQEGNPERAVSMRMAVEPRIIKLIDKWREQYHLLPLYGVRVNGSDIADKEFVWRPPQAAAAGARQIDS